MENLILAKYNGVAVTTFMVLILGLSVLYKCHSRHSYDSTFLLTLGLCIWAAGECLMRVWFSAWKARYMARDASVWMLDHWIIPFSCSLIIGGGLLIIKTLTEESPYGRIWKLCAGIVLFVMFLTWVKR